MPLKEMATPKRKADWPDNWLHIKEPFLPENMSESDKAGMNHAWLARRMNASETQNSGYDVSHWGKIRILKCLWRCPTCNVRHTVYIPERWVDEGKAVFMEVVS